MSSPWEVQHFFRTQAQKDEEIAELSRLVSVMSKQADVLREQAEAGKRAQRVAWWFSALSVTVAIGSLSVAIIALVVS